MGDILSQSEIDDLFKALSQGELNVNEIKKENPKKGLKVYDFRRPSKFSKEQLKALEIVSESYARAVSTYLSGYLRSLVPVEVIDAEAITYSEFNNALSNPVVLSIINFSPLKGSVLLDLSPNLAYAMIDRILGGKGKTLEKMREFTEIEHVILEKIVSQLIELLVEPWSNIIELNPSLEKIETNSQVVQIISPNEIVVLINFRIKLGNVEGLMNLCLPHLVLETIMDRLNTKQWFALKETDQKESYSRNIQHMVQTSYIPIKAVLGKTHITVEEFLGLQPMDVIRLDREIYEDIDMYIGDLLKFHGKPGTYKNKTVVKVTEVIEREDEE